MKSLLQNYYIYFGFSLFLSLVYLEGLVYLLSKIIRHLLYTNKGFGTTTKIIKIWLFPLKGRKMNENQSLSLKCLWSNGEDRHIKIIIADTLCGTIITCTMYCGSSRSFEALGRTFQGE
jgi:hypothetical protein